MTDQIKLDPASLTAEERAIVDHEASRFHRDWAASARYQTAMNLCEPFILARRALFAPEEEEEEVWPDQKWEESAQPSPAAPPAEMPEAVREAARILRVASKGYVGFTTSFLGGKADALESWWRSQPAPALRMTEELELVLRTAEMQRNDSMALQRAIAAVRAQASQPQRVKLPKVREFLNLMGLYYRTTDDAPQKARTQGGAWQAALAELDAAEGKVTG